MIKFLSHGITLLDLSSTGLSMKGAALILKALKDSSYTASALRSLSFANTNIGPVRHASHNDRSAFIDPTYRRTRCRRCWSCLLVPMLSRIWIYRRVACTSSPCSAWRSTRVWPSCGYPTTSTVQSAIYSFHVIAHSHIHRRLKASPALLQFVQTAASLKVLDLGGTKPYVESIKVLELFSRIFV